MKSCIHPVDRLLLKSPHVAIIEDGNDAPSAVYMYHATWTSSIGDESASGNVTLSR